MIFDSIKDIENQELFFTTQEKQTIIQNILYSIKTRDKIQIGKIEIPPNGRICKKTPKTIFKNKFNHFNIL